MLWVIPFLLYIASALVLWTAGGRAPRLIALATVSPFVVHLLMIVAWALGAAEEERAVIEWVPSLDLSIPIRIDEMTMLLWGLVAGVGLLIALYSLSYFKAPEERSRFLALMILFTAGMVGVVGVDDLLGVFVFWEVTTVASYLLIGFDDRSATARAAALQAVLVTTAGGLAMLAGIVLLLVESGTTSISVLVAEPPQGTWSTFAMFLLLAGAFTKSAQMPFHFWLPNAMAAPTPASAYLHSATMVKAGLVLLLLLEPVFGGNELWAPVVTIVGAATMLNGGLAALRQTDLKLLLAHGTLSQLGLMTALIGLGLSSAALAVLVAHAAFKAALFLVVGVIDKRAGSRDIRALGGLASLLPVAAVVAGLAAFSMAGLPPLAGFVTKEGAYDSLISAKAWGPLIAIAAGSALTVGYSARFWFGAFGPTRGADPPAVEPGRAGLIAPPAILALLSLVAGLVPGPLSRATEAATGQAVKLVLWPGFVPALGVSGLTIGVGLVLHRVGFGASRKQSALPAAEGIYGSLLRLLNRTADFITGVLQNGSLPVYLAVTVSTVASIPAAIWVSTWESWPDLPVANSAVELFLGLVVIVAAVAATRADRRLAAALLLGVVGYAVAGVFVAFGAPDLALTQLLVETLTIALFAFVLVRLPRRFGADPASLSRRIRLGVAALIGSMVTVGTLLAASVDTQRTVAGTYLVEAPDSGGRNVVNIILTNFRALDTLGEISVLAVAAAGIAALVRTRREAEQGEGAVGR